MNSDGFCHDAADFPRISAAEIAGIADIADIAGIAEIAAKHHRWQWETTKYPSVLVSGLGWFQAFWCNRWR